jgi:hopanoid biosynthesis associated protein HpnK
MRGCQLIVHADDFGLSTAVNEGILQAHLHGIVTSTSIMACAKQFEHAVALARSVPTLDLGVHLTLTGESPVADHGDIPSLLGSGGRFPTHARDFLPRYLRGRVDLDDVERELDAQIRKVLSAGLCVTHLDAHQHIHMLPGIRSRVGALARRYNIAAIRNPVERPAFYMFDRLGSWVRLAELAALTLFSQLSERSGAIAPDHFFGFHFGGRLELRNLLRIIDLLPTEGVCELMCHPGKADPASAYLGWGYAWQDELDALTSDMVRQPLGARGVRLISYRDLVAGNYGSGRANR